MATLAVHEAMGAKVDREATATLVLPQLWSMSMGPCKYKVSIRVSWMTDEYHDSTKCRAVWKIYGVSHKITIN